MITKHHKSPVEVYDHAFKMKQVSMGILRICVQYDCLHGCSPKGKKEWFDLTRADVLSAK